MANQGNHIELPNGYIVSIQHSANHYCDDKTVEVAVIYKSVFQKDAPYVTPGDSVAPYVTAPQLIEIIEWARKQKGEPPNE